MSKSARQNDSNEETSDTDTKSESTGKTQSNTETVHQSHHETGATIAGTRGTTRGKLATGSTDAREGEFIRHNTGPNHQQLQARYGVTFSKAGQATKIQRLESEFGSEQVSRWADEGMPVETMGKPQDMKAFRERQSERADVIPTDIERRNQDSAQRNESTTQDDGPAGHTGVPDAVRNVISKSGTTMDDPIQREMESKMGEEFDDVQVHTGPEASAAAESLNARAFTVGNHVAFKRGEYDPESKDGKQVLAHELTHVRQQTDGRVSLLPETDTDHPGVGTAGVHVQPKLEVSSPDDPAEQEARDVAEQVVEMSQGTDEEAASNTVGEPQQADASTADDSERDVFTRTVPASQTAASGGAVSGGGESAVKSGVQGSGKALPSSTRAEMESKMGADFSGVSVHTGSEADSAAKSIGAEAYTMGSDIAFSKGSYNPQSKSGKKLLAHELTHVAQQTGSAHRSPDASVFREENEEGDSENSWLLSPEGRVYIWNAILGITNPPMLPFLTILNALGYSVLKGGVGGAVSAEGSMTGGGPYAGTGVEGLLFFDPGPPLSVRADAFPYAEIGAGVGGGAGVSLLKALQFGPTGAANNRDLDYEGTAFSLSAQYGVGAGITISNSLLQEGRGWFVISPSAGPEIQASASWVEARSGTDAAEAVANKVAEYIVKIIERLIAGPFAEALEALAAFVDILENWAEMAGQQIIESLNDTLVDIFAIPMVFDDFDWGPWLDSSWELGDWQDDQARHDIGIMANSVMHNLDGYIHDYYAGVIGERQHGAIQIGEHPTDLNLQELLTYTGFYFGSDMSDMFPIWKQALLTRAEEQGIPREDCFVNANDWLQFTYPEFRMACEAQNLVTWN
jgi:hypothetical protein